MQTDEMPHEIGLAVERVLESTPEDDDFNPLAIINELFPNGLSFAKVTRRFADEHSFLLEASLAYIDSVDQKLNETQYKFQKEIDALQEELKRNQDPERMSMIQEMISVSRSLSPSNSRHYS
jgi:hypothetical protein